MTTDPGRALVAGYDGIVSDLDGVVYRGADAVPYAVAALSRAGADMGVVYATNNASRTVATIAAQLAAVGLAVRPQEVVTSALAGAALLAEQLPPAAVVLAIGGEGVVEAIRGAGLVPTRTATGEVAAVLQGYGTGVTAADLGEASLAVAAGATWVATNTDRTLPMARGIIPGNGTLVSAVATATGREPVVVGKPYPPLYQRAAGVLGTALERTLAIGDRLETDIAGAQAAGMDSVWVLTGVHQVADLALGTATPTYAVLDLRELYDTYPPVERRGGQWCHAGVVVGHEAGILVVQQDSTGEREEIPDEAARKAVLRAGVRMVCDLRGEGVDPRELLQVAAQIDAYVRRSATPVSAQ